MDISSLGASYYLILGRPFASALSIRYLPVPGRQGRGVADGNRDAQVGGYKAWCQARFRPQYRGIGSWWITNAGSMTRAGRHNGAGRAYISLICPELHHNEEEMLSCWQCEVPVEEPACWYFLEDIC